MYSTCSINIVRVISHQSLGRLATTLTCAPNDFGQTTPLLPATLIDWRPFSMDTIQTILEVILFCLQINSGLVMDLYICCHNNFKPASSFSFNLFTKRSWLQTSSKSTILSSKISYFRLHTVCTKCCHMYTPSSRFTEIHIF